MAGPLMDKGGLRTDAPWHIWGGMHCNWTHDAEMEFQLMGDRVTHAQDCEDLGFGALFDLEYEAWKKEQQAKGN